jgi:rubrerythrin
MEKFSVDEVIEMAVKTEVLGYQFYTEMGEKFKDQKGLQNFFNDLAEMEKGHEAIFMKLKDKAVEAKVENPEEVGNYMRAMVESEFFIGSEKAIPSLEHVTNVKEALDFALGFEKETLLFFVGLRTLFSDAAPVDAVIKEEQRHIAQLSDFKAKL